MITDKLHGLVGKFVSLDEIIKDEEKQLEQKKHHIAEQVNALKYNGATLRTTIRHLEIEYQRKTHDTKAKEATVLALKKQVEGSKLQYDHDETLWNQLHSIDQTLSEDIQET